MCFTCMVEVFSKAKLNIFLYFSGVGQTRSDKGIKKGFEKFFLLEGNKTLMILFNVNLHNVWRKQNSGSNKQSRCVFTCETFSLCFFFVLLYFQFCRHESLGVSMFLSGREKKQRSSEIRDDLAVF